MGSFLNTFLTKGFGLEGKYFVPTHGHFQTPLTRVSNGIRSADSADPPTVPPPGCCFPPTLTRTEEAHVRTDGVTLCLLAVLVGMR